MRAIRSLASKRFAGGSRLTSNLATLSSTSRRDFKAGDSLHGYTVNKVQEIPELAITAYSLSHGKSGAEHLHLYRDDPNNCFAVTLRTTPEDSTGVAHILEHLALCGSEKYPCRDPFMKMTSRSMASYMNAMTCKYFPCRFFADIDNFKCTFLSIGPDATTYPFSSQNAKDYENLLNVYLDAVFFPKLNYQDFKQEGWRLEHEIVNDASSPIVLKGVVFNEMKGAFVSYRNSASMKGLIDECN